MTTIGTVVEASPHNIRVRIDRQSACGGQCVSCKGCSSEAVFITCPNDADYCVGDSVCLQMPFGKLLKNAFWGYGLMAILMFFGALLGYGIIRQEKASVIGAFLGLILGFCIVRLLFRHAKHAVTVSGRYGSAERK